LAPIDRSGLAVLFPSGWLGVQLFASAARDHMAKYGSKPEHYAMVS
jgi:hypothetical protein